MLFKTPRHDRSFDIPDEWWQFAVDPSWNPGGTLYPWCASATNVQRLLLVDVEPPERDPGIALFKKYKLIPVLMAFQSPECALPPIEVENVSGSAFPYRVMNGLHRFYASVAVGYTYVPAVLRG
jgi:hypothetical protein